jgi:hypothetical protein
MINISSKGISGLTKVVNSIAKDLKKNLAVVINETSNTGKAGIAKKIAAELAVPQKVIKQEIKNTKATALLLQSNLRLRKTSRISLRYFGAKQNKTGVNYKISKTKGRKTIPGAFQGPKPGAIKVSWRGNVFKRVGKERLPIVKLNGPSPWGVFVINKMTREQERELQKELEKRVERRIRYLTLKAQGKI